MRWARWWPWHRETEARTAAVFHVEHAGLDELVTSRGGCPVRAEVAFSRLRTARGSRRAALEFACVGVEGSGGAPGWSTETSVWRCSSRERLHRVGHQGVRNTGTGDALRRWIGRRLSRTVVGCSTWNVDGVHPVVRPDSHEANRGPGNGAGGSIRQGMEGRNGDACSTWNTAEEGALLAARAPFLDGGSNTTRRTCSWLGARREDALDASQDGARIEHACT